ncbi:MAG TPA: NAD(P)/FAD-dependent oxidoreductase [Solirubrobacteraceae bacterium]
MSLAGRWDALVVGAGPAGLFCALQIVAAGCRRVLVIDRGPDASGRAHPPRGSASRGSYESGVGGAGLFSDGKLCLSLDVGGHLETALDSARRERLLDDIEGVFTALMEPKPERPRPPSRLGDLIDQAERNGLGFKYYPVQHIGTDRCGDVIVRLVGALRRGGATVAASTTLRDVHTDPVTRTKHAIVETSSGTHRVDADRVVLAMGKIGAGAQAELCEQLGVPVERQPIYVGVRFEADAPALAPLFAGTKDPKYNLTFDDGSKIKTHCASSNGDILELQYDGLPLAGGHNYRGSESGRSGFSLLWNGASAGDPYRYAKSLMAATSRQTAGRLLVQSVTDYRARRPSTHESLSGFRLTNPAASPGDVRAILPPDYLWRCEQFLERLRAIAPELLAADSVFYAPAIEWWMRRNEVVSPYMETRSPGVYVCGDGSGWSQGIVHAAATGLLAGQSIAGQRASVASWVARRVADGTTAFT